MSRNGSGLYNLPAGNPVVTGTTISSTWANTTMQNIADALTQSVAADGQTSMSGNLKMGNKQINNMADGTASTDAATVGQLLGFIEAGTAMLFVQTNAPTGWTKLTTQNNKALRVVSGTAGTGGTVAFTTAFSSQNVGNTTLTTAQIPAHTHSAIANTGSGGGATVANWGVSGAFATNGSTYGLTGETGGGTSHTHTLDISVQYVDVIIATKD
jgi:hypothetical protein